ncbi:olfactory receptor 4D1-like [Acropora millepora]|uniref:olfactory receptor 4D1-like n=1 Tax=Acropora millepora TaxID=45264 RepID=UPI001CF5A278|nr:olfactory receptor 4D1-like [Acropora millepora]
MDLRTMMNISEHRHFSSFGQLHGVIYRTPFFVFIFSLNIFLAITATLGNTLILIALYKVSSIRPPTKFLLRCLAMSDFCVGVIAQPLFATFLMEIGRGRWHILFLTNTTLTYTLCGFSLTTATAISVDRLLALSLGLRYRHTVTLRRVRCLVVCLLLAAMVIGFIYSLYSKDFANSAGFVVIVTSLFLSVLSHVKIFLKLRQHQAGVRQTSIQKDCLDHSLGTISIGVLLFPTIHFFDTGNGNLLHNRFNFSTVVYLNSTLNPILFCWKIREVRQAVKTTVKEIRCFSS